MSAVVRRQIEALLRGEEISVQSMNDEEEEDGGDEQEEDEGTGDDVGAYVLQRLVHEGFSKKQARRAMRATREDNKNTAIGEEDWDDRYESCLQWLLIHLNEDQLPEGLDPRGTMLDVIAAPKKAVSKDHDTFAKLYNVSTNDAAAVAKKAAECGKTMDAVFWETLIERSGVARFRQAEPEIDQAANLELLNEEIEAVKAIYDSACTIDRSESSTSFTVELPGTKLRLHVIVSNGAYPAIWPSQVLVSGEWPARIPVGVALHVALIDFISENLLSGELMVLAIFGHVQELLDRIDELPETTLQTDHQSTMIEVAGASAMEVFDNKSNTSKSGAFAESSLSRRRPRERSKFWSVPPNKTVSATAFPKISILLDKTRKALPAAAARNEFLTKLDNCSEAGSVMLVTGETGCGKTTQLCQFILEALPKDAKIVVAQPRRLAATGVAARVAEERGEERPGVSSVGYVVRGDSSICDKSRLVFCTTGILLRQLQNDNSLDCITHILVDEVHERNLDTDVLLGLLKQMRSVYPRLKIILMSATIDADRMAAYWGTGTPRMHIPGRTFPVSNFTLEDVLKLTHGADEDSVHELCERVKTLDYELIGRLVNYLVLNNEGPKDGSILVFLPGAPEISKAIEAVKRRTEGLSVVLLALHGGLQPKEQNRVFLPAPSGQTKVIFSTNIAETSVTIPDCTIVIDTCREKQSSYDPSNRMPLLVEQYASRSSLEQRRGRAGRVREGTCYKLISRQTLASLNQHAEPEIRRCALDQTLLSLLFLGVEQGFGSFMNTLLDPPSPESMQAAAHSLKLIGTVEPGATPDTLRLTPLGTLVAGIPAPPIVGKLLVMGSILGCRSAAVAMAAGLSMTRSPMLRVDEPRTYKGKQGDEDDLEIAKCQQILKARRELSEKAGNSDHALLAVIYSEWESNRGNSSRTRYCNSLGLSFPAMKELEQLYNLLNAALTNVGFPDSQEANSNTGSRRIMHACAVSAMSPSQLVKVVRPKTTYDETAQGAREKDNRSKDLKLFIRLTPAEAQTNAATFKEEQVFVHPSSSNFATGTYSFPWLVYFQLLRTGKAYLRDVTECSPYALLLFGGDLTVQASKDLVFINNWACLSANARIGSLVGGLRREVDKLLTLKIADPSVDISNTDTMRLIVKIIMTDGLG